MNLFIKIPQSQETFAEHFRGTLCGAGGTLCGAGKQKRASVIIITFTSRFIYSQNN